MQFGKLIGCLSIVSYSAGCDISADYEDRYPHRNPYEASEYEILDDMLVTAARFEDWTSSALYPLTDPFEDPYFYDQPTFLDPSEQAPTDDPAAAAALAADEAALYFRPGACARVEQRENEVTYVLTGCRAPFAPSTLDGLIRVALATVEDGIAFELSSEALQIGGLDAEITAEGVYRSAEGLKTVEYSSQRSLVGGPRPYSAAFEGTLTWTAGSNCVTRDASGAFTEAARSFATTIAGYSRCARACPTSGAVTLSRESGTDILTFAGTPAARIERANGSVAETPLACD